MPHGRGLWSSGRWKGQFHPSDRNAFTSYISRKTDINQVSTFSEEHGHHLNRANKSHQCGWDTEDFIGRISNAHRSPCPHGTVPGRAVTAEPRVFTVGHRLKTLNSTAWLAGTDRLGPLACPCCDLPFPFGVRLTCDGDLLA